MDSGVKLINTCCCGFMFRYGISKTRWCVNARHVNRSQNQKKFQEAVNNCAHTLVVLVLCIYSTCRAFRPLEVFLSRCSFCQVFMCTRVCLPQGPLSLCLRSFFRCDTLYALSRDCLATVILTTVTDFTSTTALQFGSQVYSCASSYENSSSESSGGQGMRKIGENFGVELDKSQ